MPNTPNQKTVSAWIALVKAHQVAMDTVESALKEANFPPLAWYDVLLELEKAGPSGLRLIELERKLLLAQYGVSRLASKLEDKGLVTRRQCPQDKRSQIIEINNKGKNLRQEMWPVYSSAIQRSLGARLTDQQTEMLGEILVKITSQR